MSLYHDVFFKLPRPAWGTAQPRGMEMAPEICYGHWAVAPGGQNTGIRFFTVVELQVDLTDYIFGVIRLRRPTCRARAAQHGEFTPRCSQAAAQLEAQCCKFQSLSCSWPVAKQGWGG